MGGGRCRWNSQDGSSVRLSLDPNHPWSAYRRLLTIERHGSLDAAVLQQVTGMERELQDLEAEMSRLQERRHKLLEDLATHRARWEISIRPINPDDEERQFDFMRNIGSWDHYLRYFSQKHRYSYKEIQKFVNINYDHDFALVAECCATDQLLGIAQYYEVGDKAVEMAIIVGSHMKGTGLASVLLDQLCQICRDHGRRKVLASFLAENRPAIKLFDTVIGRHGTKLDAIEDDGVVEASWLLEPGDGGQRPRAET